MSISLDVYPSTDRMPSIYELAREIETLLEELEGDSGCIRIWECDEVLPCNILIELLDESSDDIKRYSDQSLLLSMDGLDYGWLSADDYKMGFDFYYLEHSGHGSFLEEFIAEDLALEASTLNKLQEFPFERASRIGHSWTMSGSAGRSRATWLLAGIAAAALAKLTDGIIYSDDGGADYEKMPEAPDTFLDWFPEWCLSQWSY